MRRLEGFTKPVQVDGTEYICLLWDTIGSNDFEKLRPLSYPKVLYTVCKDNQKSALCVKYLLTYISCMNYAYIF